MILACREGEGSILPPPPGRGLYLLAFVFSGSQRQTSRRACTGGVRAARLLSDPAAAAGAAEPRWCTQRCGKQRGPALQLTGELGACSCQSCGWAAQLEVSGARVPPTWLQTLPCFS